MSGTRSANHHVSQSPQSPTLAHRRVVPGIGHLLLQSRAYGKIYLFIYLFTFILFDSPPSAIASSNCKEYSLKVVGTRAYCPLYLLINPNYIRHEIAELD